MIQRPHTAIVILLAFMVLAAAAPTAAANEAPADTLITVNGEPITAADMDARLIAAHRGRSAEGMSGIFLQNLLDKSVNDLLLTQQALAIGMDQDPALEAELDEIRDRASASVFVRENFHPEIDITADQVREEWAKYYWRIQLRQISVRTRAEAEALRGELVAGADMDSIAREISLDTHKYQGGLHNLKRWDDVEGPLREPVLELTEGGISRVFPYREAFAVARVEQRLPPDEAAFSRDEAAIRKYLEQKASDRAWRDFIAGLANELSLERNEEILDEVRRDGESVQTGSFLKPAEGVVLSIAGTRPITEGELRRMVSRSAMDAPGAPFDSLYALGETKAVEMIVLRAAAAAQGLDTLPGVEALISEKLAEKLIENYLQEVVVANISFNRDEFAEFHRTHPEQFGGPAEVLLDVMVIADEASAQQASERLKAGADIDFVRRRAGAGDTGTPKWSPESVFSPAIRQQLSGLEIGGASDPIAIPSGFMVFKFLGRKPGEMRPIEECEMTIREMIFQQKFGELLDEHLRLLKERSEIVLFNERIERYFAGGS